MIRRLVVWLMMTHFLVGNMLLPLGDFSLIKELPQMYHAYQHLASPKEQDVFDFVGDYLLNGKELLGHNKHDNTDKTNATHFHNAAANVCVVNKAPLTQTRVFVYETEGYKPAHLSGKPTDYHTSLLRPPLA